jgi:hypothetical protein
MAKYPVTKVMHEDDDDEFNLQSKYWAWFSAIQFKKAYK